MKQLSYNVTALDCLVVSKYCVVACSRFVLLEYSPVALCNVLFSE